MILALLSLASAADVFPSSFNPSAVPFAPDQRVQVEMDLGGVHSTGSLLGSWENRDVVGGMRTAVDLTNTLRITAGAHSWRRVGTRTVVCCILSPSDDSPRTRTEDLTVLTATAGLSAQWLHTPNVTARAYIRVGSFAQVGAAVNWQSTSGRWALDATWGPGVSLQAERDDIKPGDPALITGIPEVGWSWFARPGGATSVRLGLTALAPTLTARMGNDTLYAEATAMPWVPGLFERGTAGQLAVGLTL